jgi:hypothetical protein
MHDTRVRKFLEPVFDPTGRGFHHCRKKPCARSWAEAKSAKGAKAKHGIKLEEKRLDVCAALAVPFTGAISQLEPVANLLALETWHRATGLESVMDEKFVWPAQTGTRNMGGATQKEQELYFKKLEREQYMTELDWGTSFPAESFLVEIFNFRGEGDENADDTPTNNDAQPESPRLLKLNDNPDTHGDRLKPEVQGFGSWPFSFRPDEIPLLAYHDLEDPGLTENAPPQSSSRPMWSTDYVTHVEYSGSGCAPDIDIELLNAATAARSSVRNGVPTPANRRTEKIRSAAPDGSALQLALDVWDSIDITARSDLDVESWASLFKALPKLILALAVRLELGDAGGYRGAGSFQQGIADFVHEHRRWVSALLGYWYLRQVADVKPGRLRHKSASSFIT